MSKYILAHDHGTSGSKSAIVSTEGEVIGFEFEDVLGDLIIQFNKGKAAFKGEKIDEKQEKE